MQVARISEHTKDVGAGILAGCMYGAVAVQLADELSGVVVDQARMLNAAAHELVVSVDDASHSGVRLGSTLDENLHSGQRVLGLVVLLPAYQSPSSELASRISYDSESHGKGAWLTQDVVLQTHDQL